MALSEGKARPIPVDAEPHPDGSLVWRKVAGEWRLHVLRKSELVDPGERRFRSHVETCTSPEAFRKRDAVHDPAREAVAVLEVVGLHPERVEAAPAGRRRPVVSSTGVVPAPRLPGVLLVVDGPSLAHRAFHAYERTGMRSPAGRPRWAVFGFLRMLGEIIARTGADAVLVGFDDRSSSVRAARFPDYKAGRPERSDDLYVQLDDLTEVLPELGITTVVPPGLEADDVLACGAEAGTRAGWRTVLATSDKDAFGLITEQVTVLRLVNGLDNAVSMTPAVLFEQYGVTPGQWRDYTALIGDKSDNLCGVLGIGPKTAVKLLAGTGALDTALADPDAAAAAIGKTAAAKLATAAAREAIERNRDLQAPVLGTPVTPDACRPAVSAAQVRSVLRGWGLSSLAERLAPVLATTTTTTAGPPTVAEPSPLRSPMSTLVTHQDAPCLADVGAAQDPALRTCPSCGTVCPAAMLELHSDALVLLDTQIGLYGHLAVRLGGTWRVRALGDTEQGVPLQNRRGAHHCPPTAGPCQTPGHHQRAGRLTAGGIFCQSCLSSRETARRR